MFYKPVSAGARAILNRHIAKEALKKISPVRAPMGALQTFIYPTTGGAILNTLQDAARAFSTDYAVMKFAASEEGKDVDGLERHYDLSTQEGRHAFYGRAWEVFYDSFAGLAPMAVPGMVMNSKAILNRAKAAQGRQEVFNQLSENFRQSKEVMQKDATGYGAFVAEAAEGSGAENVYLKPSELRSAMEEVGTNESALKEVFPKTAERLMAAEQTGEFIAIPTDEYAFITQSELGEALEKHGRFKPQDMSMAERMKMEEVIKKEDFSKAYEDAMKEHEETNKSFIEDAHKTEAAITQDFMNVPEEAFRAERGVPSEVARETAIKLHRDFMVTMANREGVMPSEFYEKYKANFSFAEQGEGFGQAAAMYHNPAKTIREFYNFVEKNKNNPDLMNKSYYIVKTRSGIGVEASFEFVRHVVKDHGLTAGQLGDIVRNVDIIEDGYYKPGKIGERNGQPVAVKINTAKNGKAGVLLEFLPNGDVVLRTSFFGSEANINNWMKKSGSTVRLTLRNSRGNRHSVKSIQDSLGIVNKKFKQNTAESARGWYDPSTFKMTFGTQSNFTTFLHETSHHFLNIYSRLASSLDASPVVKGDMQTILDWFGVKDLDAWNAMSIEQQRKYHEQFAYNFEIYLSEGKAPSIAMKGVFNFFANYLKRVYTSIKTELNKTYIKTELNKAYRSEFGKDLPILDSEVSSVMDRMLASDNAIKQAEAAQSAHGLFRTQKQSGMNDTQWAEYQHAKKYARETAIGDFTSKAITSMKYGKNAESKFLKDLQKKEDKLRKKYENHYRRQFLKDSAYRAQEYIKKNELPMNSTYLMEEVAMSKEELADFERRGLAHKDGVSPMILLGEEFGYSSTDQMVQDILKKGDLEEAVARRAGEEMLKNYGEFFDMEQIQKEQLKALHSDARAEMYAMELAHLTGDKTDPKLIAQAAQTVAMRTLWEKQVKNVDPFMFAEMEAKWSEAAFEARKSGDKEGLLLAARNRLLMHQMAMEAFHAEKNVRGSLGENYF